MANVLCRETKVSILKLLVEVNSIRSICRITGCHKKTVTRLLVTFGNACKDFLDERLRGLTLRHIQCDEIWTFVGKKQARLTTTERALRSDIGDMFLWTAVDQDTKLVATFAVGKRSGDNARRFMVDLASRLPEAVVAALRHKRMLLVLDNYESVACLEAAEFLRHLLMHCEGICLLVTSWQPVGLDQIEWEVSLDDGMTRGEARELFISRAKLKRGEDWVPDSESDLERIVRATQAVPLAIEYAAAWAGYNSLTEIADKLEHSQIPEPPPGFIADIPRHQSLWTCMDGLFEHLNVDDQKTLKTLGVFPETFDADAMASICGYAKAQELLVRFQRMSLIRHAAIQNRYFMHRFTREYAQVKLHEDQVLLNDVGKRFVEYFARHRQFACLGTLAPASDNVKAALDWIETEWRNLLLCAEFAGEYRDWDGILQISHALVYFFQRRGRLRDGETLCKKLSPLVKSELTERDAVPKAILGQGAILNMLGVIYQFQRRLQEAEEIFRECLPLQSGLLEAKTRNSLASVLQAGDQHNQWSLAAAQRQKACEICHLIDQDGSDREILSEEAEALANLGLINDRLGMSDDQSLALVKKSLEIWTHCCPANGRCILANP